MKIMNGPVPTEDNYEETTHAAIYQKVPDKHQDLSPFLQSTVKPASTAHNGARPTSGKHYAREHQFSKRKGSLDQPNKNPLQSSIAKNFETSKQVEGLLNRLANYMAGEIPDRGDMADLFGKDKNPNATAMDGDDTATNYTREDLPKLPGYPQISQEPIFKAPDDKVPQDLEADEDNVEVEDDNDDLDQIPEEEDLNPYEEQEEVESYLPNIYENAPSRNFRKKRHTDAGKKKDSENLFIYKDFDTSLTKVKTHIKQLPRLNQTTAVRGEDLIRDRLLSFQVKQGQLSSVKVGGRGRMATINERSEALARRQRNKLGHKSQENMAKRQARDMKHKAFWVHNSEATLPDISQVSSANQSQSLAPGGARDRTHEIERRVNDGLDPIPIKKDEKLVAPEQENDMKL